MHRYKNDPKPLQEMRNKTINESSGIMVYFLTTKGEVSVRHFAGNDS